jgi:hypothetical protein
MLLAFMVIFFLGGGKLKEKKTDIVAYLNYIFLHIQCYVIAGVNPYCCLWSVILNIIY